MTKISNDSNALTAANSIYFLFLKSVLQAQAWADANCVKCQNSTQRTSRPRRCTAFILI